MPPKSIYAGSSEQQIAELRKEALTALRKVINGGMTPGTVSGADHVRAAELLLQYANEFDPSPAQIADHHTRGSAEVLAREVARRNEPNPHPV